MTDTPISSHTYPKRFSVVRLFKNLDNFHDWIVLMLGVVLVIEMVLLLGNILFSLRVDPDFQAITAQSLFLLILVELFRLLAMYLEHHHIYVGIAAEVTVVSVLREIILEGVLHMTYAHILSIGAFLIALAALIYVDRREASQEEKEHSHSH